MVPGTRFEARNCIIMNLVPKTLTGTFFKDPGEAEKSNAKEILKFIYDQE
jgi:hypothetical protein